MKIKANYISKYIRSRRVALGMSQEALKRKLGWKGKTSQYISNIELGKCSVPTKSLQSLANALWVDNKVLVDLLVQDYRDSLEAELASKLQDT